MIVRTVQDELQQYLSDQANLWGECEKVFSAETPQDVAAVISEANRLKIPVSVCGNHTSITGASLPDSGWVLATDLLDKIVEINPEETFAIVEPGVALRDLRKALQPHNLFFSPDPTEDSCFIGGMISTNASGARSFKYGATRNSIIGLEVVLQTGEIITINDSQIIEGRLFELIINDEKMISFEIPNEYLLPDVKNAAGYHMKPGMRVLDLFIGAEGTLGVITKAKILLRRLPESYISLVVFFENLDEGFRFLDRLREISKLNRQLDSNGIEVCVIEFFDRESLSLLSNKHSSIRLNAVAAFWIEQECTDEAVYNFLLEEWNSFLNDLGLNLDNIWFSADESDRARIVKMRHDLPLMVNDMIRHRGVRKLGTDIAVPNHLFKDFYNQAVLTVKEKGIEYVAFGHFGDSHLHLNILPRNLEELELGKQFCDYICENAILIGGTFSAEHGVGKLKRRYLKKMMGDSNIRFMRYVKQLFDPNYILGRGNLFEN